MLQGKVKWFNDSKGYGFITQNNGGPDVFVHYSVIDAPGRKSLQSDQEVEYDCIEGNKGLQASTVRTPRAVRAG